MFTCYLYLSLYVIYIKNILVNVRLHLEMVFGKRKFWNIYLWVKMNACQDYEIRNKGEENLLCAHLHCVQHQHKILALNY